MNLKTYLDGTTQTELVKLLERGGFHITQGAISQWLIKDRVPAERVLQLERVSKGLMTRYELRPDLYPRENIRLKRSMQYSSESR